MPLIAEEQGVQGPILQRPDAVKTPEPGTLETLEAAFRTENTVGSWLADPGLDKKPFNPAFDPFENIKGYEDYADAFLQARDPEDVADIKARIDRELEDRETLAAAGLTGWVAAFAAGALDPINLIPVGGSAVRGYRLGGSILRGAAVTAGAGLTGATLSEISLHASQETRTLGESALNIAGATFLAGVLGGGIGTVRALRTDAGLSELAARVENELTVPSLDRPDPLEPGGAVALTGEELAADLENAFGSTVGAAQARPSSLASEKLASTFGVAEAVARSEVVGAPNLRMATSPSLAARRVVQELTEMPLRYEKNALGVATPVSAESRVKAWEAPLAESLQELDRAYVRYKTGRDPSLKAGRTRTLEQLKNLAGRGGKMGFREFKIEVGRAMRRGDAHEIPEVAHVAQTFRRKLFDPLKEAAIELKLLPEDVDVETADSYLMRLWNPEQINARRPELLRETENWLRERESHNEQVRQMLDPLVNTVRGHERAIAGLERRIERRNRTAEKIEARSEEASALNKFAFKRSEKLSQPIDEVRGEIDRISSQIEDELQAMGDLTDRIAAERQNVPGLVEIESQMQSVGRALSDMRRRAELIDAVDAADEVAAGIDAMVEHFKGIHEGFRFSSKGARASAEATELRRLERLRQKLNRQIKPFRAELKRLRTEKKKLEKRRLPGARGGAVFETKIRERVNKLSDQGSGKRAAIEDLQQKLERRRADLEDARKSLEEQVQKFQGSAKREARTALRARGRAEAGRAADAPRLGSADRAVMRTARRLIERTRIEEFEFSEIADKIADRLLGIEAGRTGYESFSARDPNVRGPLKARTFTIPDERIESFLESDIEAVARAYTRTMASDVELTRTFGDIEMTTAQARIKEDYHKLFERAGSDAQRQALAKRRDQDLADLEGMRDRLRYVYGLPSDPNALTVRGGRFLRQLNLLRLLGGMTLSAVPDMARPVMVEGVMRTMGSAVRPLVTNLRAAKLSMKETRLAGTALDMVLNSRAMSLADIGDNFGRHTRFERGMQALTDNFGNVALMNPWNAFWKQFSGMIVQSRVLEESANWATGKISQKNIAKLAASGIDEPMAKRIARQFTEHGETIDGARLANTESWTDAGAVDAFRAALRRDVDRIIVTPGAGDQPLWMSGPLGKMVGQFKSFAFAAMQRVTMAGLQDRDAAAMSGLLLSIAAGMGVYRLKVTAAGFETSDDPRVWLTEGIDRAGMVGWLFDANNILEKVTRGRVGVNALVDGPPMTRYASRNLLGALLGPSADIVGDFVSITGAASMGDWSEGDVRSFRRLMPYQNLFYTRALFDRMQEGVKTHLGVEEE